MRIVAGDIGGTKTNIGLFDGKRRNADGRDAPALVERATYNSPDHAGLEEVLDDFLDRTGSRGSVDAAAFGVAGPVLDGRVETPNLPWVVESAAIEERFEIPRVGLLNDLEATAAGIPALLDSELVVLQPGQPPYTLHAAALLAPGTGMGMALLIPVGDRWQPQPTEGGHVDLAPRTEEEMALVRYLQREFPDHVSVERAVCGPGLLNIWRFVVHTRTARADDDHRRAFDASEADAPRIIGVCGLSNGCPACVKALDLFASLYGAAAGNLALSCLALSGVYLGGGITPKLLPKLQDGTFLEAFNAKGRFRGLMERIPVRAVLNPDTALLGAAREAAQLAG